jgi:hypothetical protein
MSHGHATDSDSNSHSARFADHIVRKRSLAQAVNVEHIISAMSARIVAAPSQLGAPAPHPHREVRAYKGGNDHRAECFCHSHSPSHVSPWFRLLNGDYGCQKITLRRCAKPTTWKQPPEMPTFHPVVLGEAQKCAQSADTAAHPRFLVGQ